MIRELPTSEQPVHRLEHFGAGALSTVELLAIVLAPTTSKTPPPCSPPTNNLFGLAQLPMCDNSRRSRASAPPAPPASRPTFEIGRRLQDRQPAEKPKIKSPADAANLLMLEMMTLEQEHLKFA